MRLHATEPFYVAPELQAVARQACTALAIARFAHEIQLLAYAGPLGLTPDALEALISSGVLRRGLVHPDPASPRAEPYLSLGIAGARMLSQATGIAVRGTGPAAMKRGSQKRAHDVEVGDFCLGVLALSRDGLVKLLGIEADPKKIPVCLATTGTKRAPERCALRPDAYVLSEGPHGPAALLIEIDRGTVSLARMAHKYASYLAWKDAAGPERDLAVRGVRVLTVATDERRALALHSAALSSTPVRRSGFLLFATRRDLLAETEAPFLPRARPLGNRPDEAVPVFVPRAGADEARAP